MADDQIPHLLSIPELAECLGTGVRHVRRLVQERRVPYVKVGKFVRFDPVEISEWLAAGRRPRLDDRPFAEISEWTATGRSPGDGRELSHRPDTVRSFVGAAGGSGQIRRHE